MLLTSPWWLTALLPWLALALYLLRGRSPRVSVPFVELWQDPDLARPRRSRALHLPPIPIAALLVALLLAILAAARPAMTISSVRPPITIIVDRGATMSGTSTSLDEVARQLLGHFGHCGVGLWTVPGDPDPIQTNSSDWLGIVSARQATAMDTAELLPRTIKAALQRDDRPVVVITNRPLDACDVRIAHLVPSQRTPVQNIGFVRVAARVAPMPEAMVTVRNDSDQRHVLLRVSGASGCAAEQDLDLPPRGGQVDAFIDLPADPGEVISFELLARDDLPVDDRAWLVRSIAWPRIEAISAVRPEVARMIEVYSKHRDPPHHLPSREPARITVTTDRQHPPVGPAVILAQLVDEATVGDAPVARLPEAIDHPITRGVRNWPTDAVVAPMPASGGWTPLVSSDDHVLVAAREAPARQVWVAFNSHAFARDPDFVIFWTNVFDWLAGNASALGDCACGPVRLLSEGWQRDEAVSGPKLTADPTTGVYIDGDGNRVAMCALDLRLLPAMQPEPAFPLPALATSARSGLALAPGLLVGALGGIAVAIGTWGRRGEKRTARADVASSALA